MTIFKHLLVLLLLLSSLLLALLSNSHAIDLYLKETYFNWAEYGETVLLTETGLFDGIGIYGKHKHTTPIFLDVLLEYSEGVVKYRGQTWADNPLETKVTYSILRGISTVGYNIPMDKHASFELFTGIGINSWSRYFDQTNFEEWTIIYAPIGIGFNVGKAESICQVTNKIALNIPLANYESATALGKTVELRPGKQYSVYASSSTSYKALFLSLAYECMRFNHSDSATLVYKHNVIQVYQPGSTADMVSIKIGITF